jgi:hypothetical protein
VPAGLRDVETAASRPRDIRPDGERAPASGSTRGMLIWLGLLAYALYNYAFYLFGAAFNALFLVYVAAFATPALALVAALSRRR